ncbi:nuclear transport factor 2 family protein [Spirosoma sordidisoli]|uniref:Nuclear transport factor 2 family protein n=1 Tax=Spirosoma sordidisoli TaxID=2502893 RepID=A0A4Q2UPY2_9BACT|nr:nuclear transport factor 2 family protein [Spirosoma sordidisoli]RYC71797.1 nuclear transport factor 2 family protein [Spirosoma sordidisoli]
MPTSRQLIEVVYSVATDSNLSRILPILDEDIVLYMPDYMSIGGEYHGRRGFLTLMSRVYKRWERIELSALVFFIPDHDPLSNAVVTTGLFSGTLLPDSEPVSLPFLHYWQLKDEKIIALRAFSWHSAPLSNRSRQDQNPPNPFLNGPYVWPNGKRSNGSAP